MLMAAVVLGLSWSVTACSDDDDDKSEQRNEDADPLDTKEASVAWRWLCALTDAESLGSNWSSKSYEPTVGVESENNKNTRIVVVNDLNEARQKFSDLADVEVNQLGAEYTASQAGVGSLTWTPSKQGAQNLAEVSVDIKMIPHLQKIIYCTSDQTGLNGLFSDNVSGTSWYRFGDVVKDGEGYYWVCVRPSFAPDKGDSHWINIFNSNVDPGMPAANIKDKWNNLAKYNNATIKLPTELKYKREHIYNLTNLFHAVRDPHAYHTTVGDEGAGLGGFNHKYNGEKFVTAVGEYWNRTYDGTNGKTIYQILFNCDRETFKKINTPSFFYKGYSWWSGTTITLWRYYKEKYEYQYSGKESTDEYTTQATDGFDITLFAGNAQGGKSAFISAQFPQYNNNLDGRGYWVVRYKTGAQLQTTGKYSAYTEIVGCKDIYRYNKVTGKQAQTDLEEEENVTLVNPGEGPVVNPQNDNGPLSGPVVGCLIGKDSKFYKTYNACESNYTTPVAMVVYLGGNKRVEKGSNYNGLAIALKDVPSPVGVGSDLNYQNTDTRSLYCMTATGNMAMLPRLLDGIANTKKLKEHSCHESHRHDLAERTTEFASKNYWNLNNNFSNFFVPSMGQWILAMQGIGETWTGSDFVCTGKLNELFEAANVTKDGNNRPPKGHYASSTERSWSEIYCVKFSNDGKATIPQDKFGKFISFYSRAFIAFKYGNGGSEDPEAMPEQHMPQPPMTGYVLTQRGHFYTNADEAKAVNETPIALVLYADPYGEYVESSKSYKGMAIALNDVSGAWSNKPELDATERITDATKLAGALNGIAFTDALIQKQNDNVATYLAKNCREYNVSTAELSDDFSKWFMPSVGQWILGFKGLGIEVNGAKFPNGNDNAFETVVNAFKKAKLEQYAPQNNKSYWTITQNQNMWVWTWNKTNGIHTEDASVNSLPARPFIAFMVDK